MIFIISDYEDEKDVLYKMTDDSCVITCMHNNKLNLKRLIITLQILQPKYNENNYLYGFYNFDHIDAFFLRSLTNLFTNTNVIIYHKF